MVSIDSLRADMPWNGYERDIAPALTAFEKKAVSYTRHYAISSYTSMSVGGFLAGRYLSEVDRSGYFFGNYPDSVLMFPELLQKAGVRTMSAHAHFYFDQKAGFRQGFDVYEIVPGLSADNTTDRNVTSPGHLELAMKMLSDKANTSGTFFAYFHFLDPHDVYMTHEGIPQFGKRARDKYDGEVRFTDMHVGKLLDFVAQQPWAKDTAIIVTADHGEAFGEHKMFRHGFEVWDVLAHVPLMIQAPGITPRRIDVPRSSIDLAPTILELTGAPAEPSFPGRAWCPSSTARRRSRATSSSIFRARATTTGAGRSSTGSTSSSRTATTTRSTSSTWSRIRGDEGSQASAGAGLRGDEGFATRSAPLPSRTCARRTRRSSRGRRATSGASTRSGAPRRRRSSSSSSSASAPVGRR